MLSLLKLSSIVLLGFSLFFIAFVILAEAQTYKISDNITHIKFITAPNYADLSIAVNTFITERTYNSPHFSLISIELIDSYTVMITYTDNNEITPSVVNDAIERSKQEELDSKNNTTEVEDI